MSATFHRDYPALDRSWAEEVTRELLARGADGPAIREVLATADAQCQGSGASAAETFGPAREYAASVRLRPEDLASGLSRQIRASWPSLLGLIGMVLAFRTVDAVRAGTDVPVRIGDVVAVLGIIGIAVVIAERADVVLRHRRTVIAVTIVLFVGLVAVQTADTPALIRLPLGAAGIIVGLALVGSGIWNQRVLSDSLPPVVDPSTGSGPAVPAWFVVGVAWLLPVLTLVFGAILLAVPGG